MGTPNWPEDRHRTKRSRRYHQHQVPIDLADARWQCQTCSGVIASDDDIYCLHCKLYWQDVANGMFDLYEEQS